MKVTTLVTTGVNAGGYWEIRRSAHQGLGEGPQLGAQQIRAGLDKVPVQESGQVLGGPEKPR